MRHWAWRRAAEVACCCRTSDTRHEKEPAPMESTANVGTASLEASHGPFPLQAQWKDMRLPSPSPGPEQAQMEEVEIIGQQCRRRKLVVLWPGRSGGKTGRRV